MINVNKTLSEKVLPIKENDICLLIKSFEKDIYKLITNIFILLKNNKHIYHIDNYESLNYTKNITTGKIPLMLLLGGSAYKIYSLFLDKYYNKEIINYDDCLIDSIDYDFSIIVNDTFNKKEAKKIIDEIYNFNINIINKINNINVLENIEFEDIKNNLFLKSKKVIFYDKNKLLFTYSDGNNYLSVQINIKYNNLIYQLIELVFWYNDIISNSIYKKEFDINKCVFYQTNEFKILLPELSTLVKTNILSIKSRILNNEFNKCTKDYNRLKFIDLINTINNNNINIIDNIIIKSSILKLNKLYKKENPNLFKLPNSICSLYNSDNDKKKLYNLYNKFLDLELDKQIYILLNNDFINIDNKEDYKNILNNLKL